MLQRAVSNAIAARSSTVLLNGRAAESSGNGPVKRLTPALESSIERKPQEKSRALQSSQSRDCQTRADLSGRLARLTGQQDETSGRRLFLHLRRFQPHLDADQD